MKILYIGETKTHEQYLMERVPSHWFYGAVEMERDGHEVIWAQESASLSTDITLICKHKPDIVFIPNLNLHNHLLLLTLAACGLYRKPIYAYLHHEPAIKKGFRSLLYKVLLNALRHVFFLSDLTLEETVKAGHIQRNKCSTPGWGPDTGYYDKISTSDNGWFVSTGKENRDFKTLIEAFRIAGAPLHIITAKNHNGAHYENLTQQCKTTPNIKVTILDNTPANYHMMASEMGNALALVCPLLKDKLNYCVGLSTIVDAEGLNKPLIITTNPYHGQRPNDDGMYTVDTVSDWVDAIHAIRDKKPEPIPSTYTMQRAYGNMKSIMKI